MASRALSSGSTAAVSAGFPSISLSARAVNVQFAPTNDEPEVLEQSSDLVLEIPFQLDEQSAADKKSPDGMAIEMFDANLFKPTALHDAGNADGIVAITLADLHLQCGLGVPRINADDGSPNFLSSVQSHVDVAPLSKPMRTTCGAWAAMKSAIALGSDATIPSRLILPA
jgi:hypothetical protein